ncbi:MAG: iron export ABC transporter permease subunit FetB [Asgard group archaeon]|nr:iron export ABC transporter permease subunit FetB [Asgard group archaeon]
MAFNYFQEIWNAISDWNILYRIGLSIVLLIIIIALSFWQNTDLEKMFLWSFLRGFIQILLMGAILVAIFEINKIWLLYLVLLFMCIFAAFTIARRYPYPKIFWIELIAITMSSLLIMTYIIFMRFPSFEGIIPEISGEYIVPMGSMVISNTMTITSIVIERLQSDVIKNRGKILAALSLGASSQKAITKTLQDSFRAGLIPTTNRMAVLGVVNIPGLMSGMIIGGVNPVQAAVYQVIIFLMILSSAFIASIIAAYLFMNQFFTKNHQFNTIYFNKIEEHKAEKERKRENKGRRKKREKNGN